MLPLEIIKKFYPNASEYDLLACAVMQHFYGSKWMGNFGESDPEGK